MKVAAKFLGLASLFLWLFSTALLISIAYSASQIRVEVEDASFRVEGQTAALSLPVSVVNLGIYNVKKMQIEVSLLDENGNFLAKDERFRETIPPGTSWNFTVTLTVSDIVPEKTKVAFAVELNLAGLLPVKVYGSSEVGRGNEP